MVGGGGSHAHHEQHQGTELEKRVVRLSSDVTLANSGGPPMLAVETRNVDKQTCPLTATHLN
jgi:hypothetical protein